MSDQYIVEDETSEKDFFTQIPNIIYEMGLGAYGIAYYSILKKIAGDRGRCYMSQKKIAEKVGCGCTQIRRMNAHFSKPFDILGGKPLIIIEPQKIENGGTSTNKIRLVNIWNENHKAILEKSEVPKTPIPKQENKNRKTKTIKVTPPSPGDTPPHHQVIPPPSPGDDKEERYKEDLSSKNDIIVCQDRPRLAPNSIVFDPDKYVLPNGSLLSFRMRSSIKKYSDEQLEALRGNIDYFEAVVRSGKHIENQEAYLQNCIKYNYQGKESFKQNNALYAAYFKELHGLRSMEVLKTVVRIKRSAKEPHDTIPLSLSEESFANALEGFLRNI